MRDNDMKIRAEVKRMAEENLDVVGTFYGVAFQGVAVKPMLPAPYTGEQVRVLLADPILIFGYKKQVLIIGISDIANGIHTLNDPPDGVFPSFL